VAAFARFWKCDLHMHSPMDHSWREASTKLTDNPTDEHRKEVCGQYLAACHAAGLELIAVVDHNFASTPDSSLLSILNELNEEVAACQEREPLVIFPGFEIEAKVGKGVHLVCIFDPETTLREVDDAASKLLPRVRFDGPEPRPSDCDLQEVIQTVQEDFGGIVIAAHPDRDKGMLAKETAEHWWRQEEFINPELYAVELPKPPAELDPEKFLYRVIHNQEPGYKRKRPIGCVLSSDCKALSAAGADSHNYVGFRSTWIKMSRPSVEGLRQAFLAQETHLRYDDDSPDAQYDYPVIESVRCSDGFLQVPLLEFSPNLNCVIGGRGAGKSALFDAIRAAAGQVPGTMPDAVRNTVQHRLNKTAEEANIELSVRTHAGTRRLTLRWDSKQDAAVVREDERLMEVGELAALLPATFLSQGEIDDLAEEPEQVSMLLDQFVESELRQLGEEETRVRADLDQLGIRAEELGVLVAERNRVLTEIAQSKGQLRALSDVSDRVSAWHDVNQADEALEKMRGLGAELDQALEEMLARVDEVVERSDQLPPLEPHECAGSVGLRVASSLLRAARSALRLVANQLRSAQEGLHRRLVGDRSLFAVKLSEEWRPFLDDQRSSYERLKDELREQGLDPDEHEAVRQALGEAEAKFRSIEDAERELERLADEREELLASLRQTWRRQTEVRREKAAELSENLNGALRIAVSHQSSWRRFAEELDQEGLWRDKRRLSEEDCTELLRHLREHAREQDIPMAEAFSQEIGRLLDPDGGLIADLWGAEDRKVGLLRDWFSREALQKVCTISVPDEVEIIVCDDKGNELGNLAHVSTGQRGFAVLSLLLAEGEGPLVVDTPEEGLDNEGVYSLLVPMLREKKETRQILVVTHNANIPVNADAELIVALEAEAAEGDTLESHIKAFPAEGRRAEAAGALDREEVQRAVVEIMEGSEDAFSRRRAKYGY